MIKAVMLDFDHTYYSHQLKEVPALTQKAIRALKQKGFLLALCTSRFPAEMRRIDQRLLADFDLLIEGTGSLLVQNGKVIQTYGYEKETAQAFISYLKQAGIPFLWLAQDGQEHAHLYPDQKMLQHIKAWQGEMPSQQEWNGEPLLCISYFNASEQQQAEIQTRFPQLSIAVWSNSGEVNAPGIDKGHGLEEFARLFHLQPEEIAAFGDGANDLAMLKKAGIGIAVGGADPILKQAADMVCGPIEEGGIFNACVQQGWLEKPTGIHLLFFDIDHTSYDNSIHDLRPSTRKALQLLKANGMQLAINTSRAYEEMSELPQDFVNSMDALITAAGSRIMVHGKEYDWYLNQTDVQKGLAYFQAHQITYRWLDDQGHCCLNQTDEKVEQLFRYLYHMVPEVRPYQGERLIQLLYYSYDPEILKQIDEIFSQEVSVHLGFANEVTPQGIDKASAMAVAADHLGDTMDQTAAFGDGVNDAEMLKAAAIGIAMGNACSTCRQAADYVTDTIERDGLYKACAHFGWISDKSQKE